MPIKQWSKWGVCVSLSVAKQLHMLKMSEKEWKDRRKVTGIEKLDVGDKEGTRGMEDVERSKRRQT